MINRTQSQHIFQMAKTPLDLHELLVPGHGFEQTNVFLARGNDVATFQALFLRQAHRILFVVKDAVTQLPAVITRTMMGG